MWYRLSSPLTNEPPQILRLSFLKIDFGDTFLNSILKSRGVFLATDFAFSCLQEVNMATHNDIIIILTLFIFPEVKILFPKLIIFWIDFGIFKYGSVFPQFICSFKLGCRFRILPFVIGLFNPSIQYVPMFLKNDFKT